MILTGLCLWGGLFLPVSESAGQSGPYTGSPGDPAAAYSGGDTPGPGNPGPYAVDPGDRRYAGCLDVIEFDRNVAMPQFRLRTAGQYMQSRTVWIGGCQPDLATQWPIVLEKSCPWAVQPFEGIAVEAMRQTYQRGNGGAKVPVSGCMPRPGSRTAQLVYVFDGCPFLHAFDLGISYGEIRSLYFVDGSWFEAERCALRDREHVGEIPADMMVQLPPTWRQPVYFASMFPHKVFECEPLRLPRGHVVRRYETAVDVQGSNGQTRRIVIVPCQPSEKLDGNVSKLREGCDDVWFHDLTTGVSFAGTRFVVGGGGNGGDQDRTDAETTECYRDVEVTFPHAEQVASFEDESAIAATWPWYRMVMDRPGNPLEIAPPRRASLPLPWIETERREVETGQVEIADCARFYRRSAEVTFLKPVAFHPNREGADQFDWATTVIGAYAPLSYRVSSNCPGGPAE
ncbi:MAG: hypothetical protein KAY22_02265 [Rhizorhabdus sp.]|uniref:hypothetical protein n=1 Tax=Rhizorhabdus sp. TaxID=1968843 RepID=UPI001B443D3A|nr:hypothetical protein [Rhizorhabdus sp.]MBP8231105.1 hypothetical protein [Rhizorhabdus sp.]